ncbi:Orotidine 5'-phosphate decarboxylase [Aeromicrobium sp. Root495]|uniref:orotidine-5'-phosphate decarboxylase n=1 Tax=Aeromicrobium sp. Root495 TaxID=1736550 RepID=UPI0006FECE5C|nr:orotidine-5'-phosphate decarboxylase [Aeromicrobium sp. Root495]KQY59175.1 Orotidine 5'-phosphate decarboxylase [Aeromicrobium sp. Root495]RYJ06516.1 MAG: orotidine-5'-phosphate decarboxylase [Actinomycetales bacterium]
MSFGSRARAAIDAYGPACIGIDPHSSLLEAWGLGDDLDGLERFAATCVEAFAGKVGFVKPQSAFFERFGSAGVAVLERTIQDLRHTGSLVVLDVKRGDIGSTAAAYADAYLDEDSPMCADAVTVSPFLGFGSLAPFLAAAEKNDGGVFVLALTSNPEGPEVQHARTDGPGERTVAGTMLDHLRDANAGATPMGSYGAVVGATIGSTDEDLDINGPLLVPGYGAQGGTVDDLRRLFGDVSANVLPSTSRGVLAAGPDVTALRDAALRTNDELRGL